MLQLGKKITHYPDTYTPELLYAIARAPKREEIGIPPSIEPPFIGLDWWNCYEFSFLDEKTGWPKSYFLSISVPATSPKIVESKSLKLYLYSFTHSLLNELKVIEIIERDLNQLLETTVKVTLHDLSSPMFLELKTTNCELQLNDLTWSCDVYHYSPALQVIGDPDFSESFAFEMQNFKSECLITHQPDWACLSISGIGPKIDKKSLYEYLVSFRQHHEFHEQCVERIYCDLMRALQPEELTVKGFFKRRGSLDINPMRSSKETTFAWHRYLTH